MQRILWMICRRGSNQCDCGKNGIHSKSDIGQFDDHNRHPETAACAKLFLRNRDWYAFFDLLHFLVVGQGISSGRIT